MNHPFPGTYRAKIWIGDTAFTEPWRGTFQEAVNDLHRATAAGAEHRADCGIIQRFDGKQWHEVDHEQGE